MTMIETSEETESNYTLEVIPNTEIALFRWTGPIDLEDRKQNLRRMAEFCATHDLNRIIVDGLEQMPRTDVVDSFQLGQDVPDEMRGLRIAVVHRVDDESLKFIETVAFNRGAITKAFQDCDEARAWLESFDDAPA